MAGVAQTYDHLIEYTISCNLSFRVLVHHFLQAAAEGHPRRRSSCGGNLVEINVEFVRYEIQECVAG